jgi:hypothetical protein
MSVNDRKILVAGCFIGVHGSVILATSHSMYWLILALAFAIVAIFQFDVKFKGE